METPYELLIKYCREQLSPEEKQTVEQWLAEGRNRSLFSELKKEWEFIDDPSVAVPDKQQVWKKIQARIDGQKKRVKRLQFIRMAAAASILLVVAAAFSLYYFTPNKQPVADQYTTLRTNATEKTEVLLPDGTKVWLNANSVLSYNNQYNTKTREVSATGEFFFEVTPSSKKFCINAGNIRVEVLGTSFYLKAIESENIEISLKEGKVAVFHAAENKRLFVMAPSQTAVVDKHDFSYVLETESSYLSDLWTVQNLEIYNEPLSGIFQKLEIWYGIKIHSSGLDLTKRYTFHLEKENLQDFLNIFSAVAPVKYRIEGKNVFIEAIQAN